MILARALALGYDLIFCFDLGVVNGVVKLSADRGDREPKSKFAKSMKFNFYEIFFEKINEICSIFMVLSKFSLIFVVFLQLGLCQRRIAEGLGDFVTFFGDQGVFHSPGSNTTSKKK